MNCACWEWKASNFSISFSHSVFCKHLIVSVHSSQNFLVWFALFQAYLIYSSSVAAGAQSGIEECKYQFAWDRWNCPERALQLSTHSGLRSGENYDLFGCLFYVYCTFRSLKIQILIEKKSPECVLCILCVLVTQSPSVSITVYNT